MVNIKVKKLSDKATIPTRGSEQAAGYDLYAANTEMITIAPHETVKVPTDLAIEIPNGYFGGVFARSGLATKSGLRPANCVGVVDSDYRGNVIVALHNDTDLPRVIDIKERVAQLVILPYLNVEFNEVNELDETERGSNGFGSTGTN
jgi:dUTP pyrophosphatase